jgi:hypothetical protein
VCGDGKEIDMRTRGAIIREAPGSYEVVELDLAEPMQGELTVKMVGSGLCHTDDHVATGDMPYTPPHSYRLSLDGQPVGQMSGLGTFSEYTTVDVDNGVIAFDR